MTGVCGVLGQSEHDFDWMVDDLQERKEETASVYVDADVALGSAVHPHSDSDRDRDQPASVGDDVLVWVAGSIWGFQGPSSYRSYHEDEAETMAQFCAKCYAEHGLDFASGLNGTFAASIYDREAEQVYLVTDRLGTHSVYYTRPSSKSIIFSTHLQSLPVHPAVNTSFDVEYLSEYFLRGAIGGIRTPFTGINELLPSSITTVDLSTGTVETERYWQPKYEPLDRPFSYFADRFTEAFEAVLNERLDPDQTYGLLLSGGSDSRAILAGIDTDIDLRTYQMADWRSREVRTAERVASVADREFRLLKRDQDLHARMAKSVPQRMNFQGRFGEGDIFEFADQLRDEVDVLISGHGADTFFGAHAFPSPTVDLGPVGKFDLPTIQETASVDEFIERRAKDTPDYLNSPSSLSDILDRNITTDSGVTHHGVPYRSVDELVFFDDFYPFSNKSDFFYSALNSIMPHWSPFFDNRLIDIALQLPAKYRTQRDLIHATTETFDESLASIPHAGTGVPLTRSFPLGFVEGRVNDFIWKHLSGDQPPQRHMSHGPWVNKSELIRTHDFVRDTLQSKEEVLESLPFLDREGAYRCYQQHLQGDENTFELYSLLTFLNMPIVETMAEKESVAAIETENESVADIDNPLL